MRYLEAQVLVQEQEGLDADHEDETEMFDDAAALVSRGCRTDGDDGWPHHGGAQQGQT